MIWLLIYAIAVSLYDLRTKRIPNWVTLPILLVGFIAHFPGPFEIWLAAFVLILAWMRGWMGAGDVKLWLALLWALPFSLSAPVLFIMFASFLASGLAQFLWRTLSKQPVLQQLTPGAWRTLLFLLWCWHVH